MPFLRPVPMAKMGIVGLKNDRDKAISLLHDLGVIQVEPIRKEALEHLVADHASEHQRTIGEQLVRFRGLLSVLPRAPGSAPKRFESLAEILEASRTVPIDAEVGQLKREEDRLVTERTAVNDTIELLRRFSFYRDRLEFLQAESVLAFLGEVPTKSYGGLKAEFTGLSDTLLLESREDRVVRFIVAVRREQAESLGRLAQQKGVRLAAVPRLEGTISEALPKLTARRDDIDHRLAEIQTRLRAIANLWYPTIATLEEGFAIENRKLEVIPRLGSSGEIFAMEGWVPRSARGAIGRALDAELGDRAYVYDIATQEEPPTVLSNPRGVRWYEFFIRFYSLPEATEWDPTWVFAVVFPLFFGLMLGDIGYGLVILLVSIWMIRGFPGARRLPKFGRNFMKLIMTPSAMRSLAYALVPGCFVAIAVGLLDNEFFGVSLIPGYQAILPLDRASLSTTLPLLLKFAGFLGLGMVIFGFTLGALKAYFHHHIRECLGKIGGIGFAIGIASLGLAILHGGTAALSPATTPSMFLAYPALLVGFGLLVAGEGFGKGGLAMIEVISHILSFTRLIGILLASVVFALLINTISFGWIGGSLGGPAFVGIFAGIALLIIGQMFNVILGVFEPGIQGARLLFVEYFSKFYEGNGTPFHPLRSRRVYTVATHPATPAPPGA